MDDLTLPFTPERLHNAPAVFQEEVEAELAAARKLRRKKKKRLEFKSRQKKKKSRAADDISSLEIPTLQVNEDAYDTNLPDLAYENTIKVPEHLLVDVKRKTKLRTQKLSHMMMDRLIPSFLALEASQSYVTTAMRDGLGVDVEIDDAITEATKSFSNLELVYFFLRRSSLPMQFKKQYLSTFVDEMAKHTMVAMVSKEKDDKQKRHFTEMQSIITRGMTAAHRNEDGARSRPVHPSSAQRAAAQEDDEGPFGVMDNSAPTRHGRTRSGEHGALRTGRRRSV